MGRVNSVFIRLSISIFPEGESLPLKSLGGETPPYAYLWEPLDILRIFCLLGSSPHYSPARPGQYVGKVVPEGEMVRVRRPVEMKTVYDPGPPVKINFSSRTIRLV